MLSRDKYLSEILEKDGDISDSQLAKIWGDETEIYKASEHIRKWKKLQADRNFFADKEIIEKRKGYRCHIVRVKGQDKNEGYKVGKEFYKSLP